MLENIRVVLVGTTHPGNIGGAARAMKNMGLSKLVLVAPEAAFPSPEASARASGADDLLAGVEVFPTLEQALGDCTLVLGTSARDRALPWPMLGPREAGAASIERAAGKQQVALVFGREHAGLTNDELQRCHYHVHIPSNPDFSSLNLAAAVQVLAYEVRMAWLGGVSPVSAAVQDDETLAIEDMERFYDHLQATLVDIGFLDPENPRHLMARLRRLFARAGVQRSEMNILRGILTETRKAASGQLPKQKD